MRPRLLLAFVALAAACAAPPGDSGGPTAPVGTSPPAPASDGAADPLVGSAPTLAGGDLELSSLRGQALALWFWAPW